jgi:hypothetical protein
LEIIRQVCEAPPKSPRQIVPEIPEPLDAICLRCLQKDPKDRYPTAADLAEDLDHFLNNESLSTPPPSRETTSTRRSLALGIAAVLVIAVLAVAYWKPSRALRERGTASNVEAMDMAPVGKPIGTPITGTPSPVAVEQQAPLTGDLSVRIWDPKNSARRGISFNSPGALPLRHGDQIRIEVRMNRPAYLYLIWIDTNGAAIPVYPWDPVQWKREYWTLRRPNVEHPVDSLSLPDTKGNDYGWTVETGIGFETLVLLARDKPLPKDVSLGNLFSGLPAQNVRNAQSFVWLEPTERARDRGVNFSKLQKIDDSTLELKSLLEQRLKPHFPLVRLELCLPNRGS